MYTYDKKHPNNDIWQMILSFRYDILLKHISLFPENTMRYQSSQDNKSSTLANILNVLNFILLVVIAVSFNYLVINFLF